MEQTTLIVDSGGTKAVWAFENETFGEQVTTAGMNPLLRGTEELRALLHQTSWPVPKKSVKEIYFYGAGCGTEAGRIAIHTVLSTYFTAARITIENDLLGAARSVWGAGNGLVGILGTGAHAAYYAQGQLQEKATSLGWLLSDEGSGARLGQALLERVLRRKLSSNLLEDFARFSPWPVADLVPLLYQSKLQQRFMAQFTPFLKLHIEAPEISQLVTGQLSAYVAEYLKPMVTVYPAEVRFVGSVAYHFQDQLLEVLSEHQLHLGKVTQAPINGLVEYHKTSS
ncbi:hypothetical protein [Persicobacter psychrovividus]|uniref:ATPase n=1 Tax=Persicobacter psychrovividus TaxID=387638 RepID=A0ABM7VG82_9BACT|nr:ATPase [Persicobacter psychrovividus]